LGQRLPALLELQARVSSFTGGFNHGYLEKGNIFRTIEPPNVLGSYLSGINDQGAMVGGFCTTSCNPREAEHGFLYLKGKYKTFDYPATGTSILPLGINNLGQIVGGYCPGSVSCQGYPLPSFHGFLKTGNKYTTLDYPNASATQANAINDAGQIVGFYTDAATVMNHAFFYQNGVFTQIDVPGSQYTTPYGINNAGVVSGLYADSHSFTHGFTYQNGVFTPVDIPSAYTSLLTGISNSGDVVGDGYFAGTNKVWQYLGVPSH
jgi:probable HAF family extracellular repeat protein